MKGEKTVNRLHTFDVLTAWYREYLAVRGYRPSTARAYCYELSFFRRFLIEHTELADIDELDGPTLRGYISSIYERGIGMSGGHYKLTAVRSFLGALYDEKKLYLDLRSHIHLPRRARKLPANVLSEEHTAKLFGALENATAFPRVHTLDHAALLRDRAILETLYSTGVRLGELRRLALRDIDYEGGVVFVRDGKGGKDRVVPIGRTARESLRRYTDEARPLLAPSTPCDTLFLTRFGRPIGDYTIREAVRRAAAAAGLEGKVRVHDIRHTCATHMLNHGADIRYVQELLGHASLSSTQIYTHVSIRRLRETHERHHPREKGAI